MAFIKLHTLELINDNSLINYSYIPTQAEVQTSLRDIYNLHIEIRFDSYVRNWYHKVQDLNLLENDFEISYQHSYEDALEAGLVESLNMLINRSI